MLGSSSNLTALALSMPGSTIAGSGGSPSLATGRKIVQGGNDDAGSGGGGAGLAKTGLEGGTYTSFGTPSFRYRLSMKDGGALIPDEVISCRTFFS